MQKFHSKMTPRDLYTQFHLTEITYAKVCIIGQVKNFGFRVSVQNWSLEGKARNSNEGGKM